MNLEGITTPAKEAHMRRAFWRQAHQVLNNPEQFEKRTGLPPKTGLEVEQTVIANQSNGKTIRDAIVKAQPEFADVELGGHQLETRTPPFQNPADLLTALQTNDRLTRSTAQNLNAQILSSGIDVFTLLEAIPITDTVLKYLLVPAFHQQNRVSDVDTQIGAHRQDIGTATIPGIFNAIHPNVEATDFNDAIDKLNQSLAIGPMALALFANARFLEGKDTKIQNLSAIAWQKSHQVLTQKELAAGTDPRTGLPNSYFKSMQDYFDRIAKHPFIQFNPTAALPMGIGEYWKDTRIKVINDSLVVEFRTLATQATPEENFAAAMFYLGRLLYAQQTKEPLLGIDKVRKNRHQAMQYGSQAQLYTNTNKGVSLIEARNALAIEIDRSLQALIDILPTDLYRTVKDSLEGRLNRRTPSEELAQKVGILPTNQQDAFGLLTRALIKLAAIR